MENHQKRKPPPRDEASKAGKEESKKKCHRYKTKYNPEWAKEFPIQRANNNLYAFTVSHARKMSFVNSRVKGM